MKTKTKSTIKRIFACVMAAVMLVGLVPGGTTNVQAATTKTVDLDSLGSRGTVSYKTKTKSGTWWQMSFGNTKAFCMSLGKTCHSGNTYSATETKKWNQDTTGKSGQYAKVVRWYDLSAKKSKKGYIMAQALMWAIEDDYNSEDNLKTVIGKVQSNTGYYSSYTKGELYKKIFKPTGNWEATCTYWKKTGGSKNYQVLLTVDAEDTPDTYKPESLKESEYYRQRITVHKKDEDGKGLGGIKFTLSAHNLDDLYSFSGYDKDGTESSTADEDDIDDFELSGETTDGGTVAWRMTYKLMSQRKYYFTDSELNKMSDSEKKAAKDYLEDVRGLDQGIDFGISNDNQVVGLDDPEGDAEKICEVIKTRLDPIPEFKLRFHKTEDGKVLVILDVYTGDETPYYYSADGVLEAYVRVGNESVKATATELKRLVLRGKNTSYDSQNSTYKVEDYAFSRLKERYKKWTGNSFDDKDLISFGLVNEQGDLTNAGALLADESPIRCSRLFCTRWNGLNKSGGAVDALDDAEYSGSVISLIENGEAFIKRNCKMKWRKTANSKEEMPEYVERSYHEALVNALAHRDYLVNGSEVHIDIYDDRMEIYSPGGMPDGSIIQDRDPLTVPSTRRNPVLADVFNRLGYMERKGSGFGKIISGYEFQINYNESKRPSFRSDRYQFTVVMSNLNYDVPQDVPQDKLDVQIVDMIRKENKISTEKIAIALGVSSKTIKRHIKEMDNVCYVGRGFSGHWEIKDDE